MKTRAWTAALLAVAFVVSLSGCRSDLGADRRIIFEIDGAPKNVDPQLAKSETELLIVRNTFEGLCRLDAEGLPSPALAEDVAVQGTRYTFTLRKGLKWQDETPLTAADVVFGIRRALLPETKAPLAERLYSIKNAKEVRAGTVSPDKLGLSAPDSRTVVIDLIQEDNDFLSVLATSVAMPCNEAFFLESGGRYGLGADTILCNGPFYLDSWDPMEYIRINRNKEYATGKVRPSGVTVYFNRDPAYRAARLEDGRCDAALSPAWLGDSILSEGIEPQLIYHTVWSLVLNPEKELFSYPEIRKAFLLSVNHGDYGAGLPGNLMAAEGFVPPGLSVRGLNFRENAGIVPDAAYDPDGASGLFQQTVLNKKIQVGTVELLYSGGEAMKALASRIAQFWQQNLGLVVNIRELSRTDLAGTVSAGSFTAALVPALSHDGTVKSLLSGIAGTIPLSGVSPAADLQAANASLSDDALFAKLREIEQKLLKADNLQPAVFDAVCFAAGKGISGIRFGASSGEVDFIDAGKLN